MSLSILHAHATFQDHSRCKSDNEKEIFRATWYSKIFKKPSLNRAKGNKVLQSFFRHAMGDEQTCKNGCFNKSIPKCKFHCFLQLKLFFQLCKFSYLCIFTQNGHEINCLKNTTLGLETGVFKGTQVSGQRLTLVNRRFLVRVRLQPICRGELPAVIARLMSNCL